MNIVKAFLGKIGVYLFYAKEEYLFWRSKKYITTWGKKSYGIPSIVSYDKKSVLSVGSYVSIASGTSILLGANHKRGLVTTFPIDRLIDGKTTEDANERGDVWIGSDVWIGYGATIIGNVSIGHGAIIGANALVLEDVPPYAVVGGIPAKVIKYRFTEDQVKKLLEIKWWDWAEEKIEQEKACLYSETIDSFLERYYGK